MKILIFTLGFFAAFALTRIPVAVLGRKLRGAPGSWYRYVRPLLVPLHLLMTATVIHIALSSLSWSSSASAFTVYAALGWLVFRAITTLIFEWWFTDVRGVVLPSILRRVLAFAVGFAGVLALLNVAYEVRPVDLAIVSGVGALVAGLLFQGVMRDALLGISMLLEKRVVVGDYVRFEQHEGEVVAVDWKSTTLRTTDDEEVVLPNRLVVDSAIVRCRRAERHHRVRVEVEVSAELPPNAALDALVGAVSSTRSVLRDPAPMARLLTSGAGAHRFEVLFWVEEASACAEAASQARSVIWYRLRRAGLADQASLSSFEQTHAALAGVPLFAAVAADTIERLARSVSVQRFGRGEVLFRQGEAGDTLFVVLSGQLDITSEAGGRAEHVASVHAGNFIGERSLMTGEARSATATAGGDTVAVVIDKAHMLDALRGDPELAGRIAGVMAERAGHEAARERAARDTSRDDGSSSLLAKIRAIFSL